MLQHLVMWLLVHISVNSVFRTVKNNFHHAVTILLVAFLLLKIPDILKMYQKQGEFLTEAQVVSLKNEVMTIPLNQKQVLIFWATWCGPCGVELSRIQNLIDKNQIKKESVLAVSIGESAQTVQAYVDQKKYTFPVAIDSNGLVAQLYEVNGTPTVFLVDENKKIHWITTGLSPSLELRLKSFF